jgi:hypothetical protein
MMKTLLIVICAIVGLAFLFWVGLQIDPAPLPGFPQAGAEATTVPLSNGLPEPVERFYLQVYGAQVPVIQSFVVSGRAKMRVMGVTFPSRFRFTHRVGQGYRHYIETTVFGLPLMRVNEHYLEGHGRLELPFGVEEGPNVDQGANLGLWAERLWMPSILITDPRVRWTAIDGQTALLTVPFGDEEQHFVVRFDPQTGMPQFFESMRYKGAESEDKTLWINQALEWGDVDGHTTPTISAATWFDEGSPWAVFSVEEIRCNVDVREYIQAKGP